VHDRLVSSANMDVSVFLRQLGKSFICLTKIVKVPSWSLVVLRIAALDNFLL
jgi:hypothetical protein